MIDDLRSKIAFSMIRNSNSGLSSQLLDRVGSEGNFFRIREQELKTAYNVPESICSDAYRRELRERAREEERFILSHDISALYFKDDTYPTRLLRCDDGPTMLYQFGCANLEARHIVSIVGTRHATSYGIDITNRIVSELAEKIDDLVIISGLAYGIDVTAHLAALNNNIPTVAVSANPLNTIYPADHRSIAERMIRNGGAIVTEYTTSDAVHRSNFLARNRIIAGLADVTIVVESDSRGGSLVTAGLALEYNREVFAVPGRLTDKYSRGTVNLIAANKAHMFFSVDDLIAEMGWTAKATEGSQLEISYEMTENEQKIYDFLINNSPSSVNDIMMGTSLPAGTIKDLLFNLEMNDMVMTIGGNKFSAISID